MLRDQATSVVGGLLLLAVSGAAMAQADTAADPLDSPPQVYPNTIAVGSEPPKSAPARGESGFGPVLQVNLEFGGDDIATLYFDDGSDQDINTGQGATIAAGLHYRFESNWDVRGTVGYKYVSTKASDANIYVDRIVFEGAVDYVFPAKWYIGGGIVQHSKIKFHTDGYGDNLKFDNATGYMIEAGWSFIGISYTFMDYQDEFGFDYDANTIGIDFIGRF